MYDLYVLSVCLLQVFRMPNVYVLYVCRILTPYMHAVCACLICRRSACLMCSPMCMLTMCIPYALCVCLMCMPYVYADYVCLTCIPHLQVFRKYDCAFLKSDVGQEPYVVRIEDMWEQVRTCGNRFTLSMRPYVCSHCVRTCGNRSRILNLCVNPLSKTLIYTLRGDRGRVRTGLEGMCEQGYTLNVYSECIL